MGGRNLNTRAELPLTTRVETDRADFRIEPSDRLLFVGSCFAGNVGRRLADDNFCVTVNPYGTMYNPASVSHTVVRAIEDGTVGTGGVDAAVFTLGTNRVYILNETGEIVDNCQKRPQSLFAEREMGVEECAEALRQAMNALLRLNSSTKFVLTVSPIRYAKYGYHGSRIAKATLLLAVDYVLLKDARAKNIAYFPAYEIMNDELRDYRFYQPDMLHPSGQAVEYIYERFAEAYFSDRAKEFVREWRPICAALNHRPFDPDGEEYRRFIAETKLREIEFKRKWKL